MTTETPPARTPRAGRYDPTSFEEKWRQRWEADELYVARDDDPRPKRYDLTMYPYPSGDLHIGHWYAMTGPDIVARMHRMQGYNVMFPMGFDGFGLPAENAAIDRGIHPAKWTYQNIDTMRRQMRVMGASFDWTREVVSCDPEYYRWQQWLFLKLYEAGLAYKAMGAVDWCPKDKVVLAREQVVGPDRRCWRCNTQVTKRDLEQWYFRITNYSDELLNFDGLDYPEPIKSMQTNWIGRSEGAEIDFPTEPDDVEPIRVFTTRPDTVYGATFMVLAPEHPLVSVLTTEDRKADVEAYVADARRETEIERMNTEREKTGVFIGAYAINPMTNERIPIWIADYVLPGYGTGAIMAVPAHDERDFEFAKKFDLPIRYVVVARLRPAAGGRGTGRAHGRRGAHRLGRVHRDARIGGNRRHHPGPGRARAWAGRRNLPPARLGGRAPALLGRADPDHLLRRARRPTGAGGPAAGGAAAGRRLRADRRQSAAVTRRVPARRVSGVRRRRPARDRHDGHVRRLELVFPALLLSA